MCVYNGVPYVEDALRSIMNQTLKDLEIVVVDDASSDDTPEVLARLAAEDSRLKIHRLAENSGISAARSTAMGHAIAPLVAVMDADDISHPNRLQVQKACMDADPDLSVVGSSIRQIDSDSNVMRVSHRPRDDVMLRWLARFHMPFNHSSMMMRKSVLDQLDVLYDPRFPPAEDYDLAVRLLEHGKGLCLADALVDYRIHTQQSSQLHYQRQSRLAAEISYMVQSRHLPEDLRANIAPFCKAYLEHNPMAPSKIFAAMDHLIAYDIARAPDHTAFFRRHGAQLVWTALRRSGISRLKLPAAFASTNPQYIAPLAARYLETKGLLH